MSTPASETKIAEITSAGKHCLNCGTEITDAYCPHCGQKSSVERLTVKTAIVDNFWSVLRMDKGVLRTALLLVTRPWKVIRDYINGHRVSYTQPVRFIVIMCFIGILVQLFNLSPNEEPTTVATGTIQESFWLHIWHSVQNFLSESEVATDLIDSVIFVPFMWLIYLPWGSRRFNFAEYSTAYLYLCGTGLVLDLVVLPFDFIDETVSEVLVIFWWLYLLNGLVKHAFHIKRIAVRTLVLFVNITLMAMIMYFNRYVLLGQSFF